MRARTACSSTCHAFASAARNGAPSAEATNSASRSLCAVIVDARQALKVALRTAGSPSAFAILDARKSSLLNAAAGVAEGARRAESLHAISTPTHAIPTAFFQLLLVMYTPLLPIACVCRLLVVTQRMGWSP